MERRCGGQDRGIARRQGMSCVFKVSFTFKPDAKGGIEYDEGWCMENSWLPHHNQALFDFSRKRWPYTGRGGGKALWVPAASVTFLLELSTNLITVTTVLRSVVKICTLLPTGRTVFGSVKVTCEFPKSCVNTSQEKHHRETWTHSFHTRTFHEANRTRLALVGPYFSTWGFCSR